MDGVIATVRVVSKDPDHTGGFYVINASDFDPAVHTAFEEGSAPSLASTPAPKRASRTKQPIETPLE